MREGWEVKKLEDLCSIQLGKTPRRETEKFWDKEKTTSNVWLSISDMVHGEEIFDSKEYVSNLGAKNINITPQGTLLLSYKLTLGRVSFAGNDLFTNEAIASLINLSSNISKKYLFYYFTYFDWDKATKGDIKVKGKTLNKEKLKSLLIIAPPLLEQQRIVKILDESFTAIDKIKQNTQQNIKNAKELFDSYLNGIFATKGDDWEVGVLDQVVKKGSSNISLKNIKDEKGDYPVFSAKGFAKNVSFFQQEQEYLAIIKDGAGIGRVSKNPAKSSVASTMQYLIPKEGFNIDFIKYFLMKIDFDKYKNGSTIPHIYFRDYKSEQFPLPPLSEQKEIVKKLDALQIQTKKLEAIYRQKIINLVELKKSILQKAFKGEL